MAHASYHLDPLTNNGSYLICPSCIHALRVRARVDMIRSVHIWNEEYMHIEDAAFAGRCCTKKDFRVEVFFSIEEKDR